MYKIHKMIVSVEGMSCSAAAVEVEDTLKSQAGVLDAEVNFATEKAKIDLNPAMVSVFELDQKLREKGYGLLLTKKQAEEPRVIWRLRRATFRLFVSIFLSIPIIVLMLFEMVKKPVWQSTLWIDMLAFPVVFLIGGNIFLYAIRSILNRRPTTDVLIAIGVLAAFATGILKLAGLRIESYAGVAAIVVTFHLLGKYFEAYMRSKVFAPFEKIRELKAKDAHLVVENGLRSIPAEDLRIDDVLLVKAGEKIPADAVVLQGVSAVDESLLTGAGLPVIKQEGDTVFGGTVNGEGTLKVKAVKVGEEAFLSKVLKFIDESQSSKIPVQAMADKLTVFFIPLVLVISGLTFFAWYMFPAFFLSVIRTAGHHFLLIHPERDQFSLAVFASISVLIIACPAALGLATPTALLTGLGIGIQNGILVRRNGAVRKLAQVNVMVFGKTGILTKGEMEITDILLNPKLQNAENQLLLYAASLEAVSGHPLASAIVAKAKERGVEITEAREVEVTEGKGLRGRVGDKYVIIGNQKQMVAFGIQVEALKEALDRFREEGKTSILVSVDSEVMGIIAFEDLLRPMAKAVVSQLTNLGIEPVMITGDNKVTAEAVARKLGIGKVVAEVLPNNKVLEIRKIQEERKIVGVVGDGINDAPALMQADVGLALGSGTDIAIEAADVVLLRDDLTNVLSAVKLARAVISKIKHNLFWAFFYNLIALPLAVLGLLHPVLATLAMFAGSINVVANSLSLRKTDLKVGG
ncbi:MAG: heavy metal translocating P-type ATPase [Candidatus Saganbacteria bacterium]|nr:heavy metal translocating P-type ATPase [Candidatus Saganbacteria bacterium]